MTRSEPPDWALPSWDSIAAEPEEGIAAPPGPGRSGPARPAEPGRDRPAGPPRDQLTAAPPPGTFGVRILAVSEVTRAFRGARLRSAFEAQAGQRVVAHGRVDLFEPQGAVQLYVESIQPAGLGDLTLRFEALKARLAAEGLFDVGRKRPLPRVVLVAAQVQGESAPASLVRAFRNVERYAADRIAAGRPEEAPAMTILARGGGSLEDLWA